MVALILVQGLALGLAFVHWMRSERAKWDEIWEAVAKTCGLEAAPRDPMSGPAQASLMTYVFAKGP